MISTNMGGYTKRSVTSSMVFAAYCVGNMIGPQFVFDNEAPRYISGAYAMMAGYIGKTAAHLLLWFVMWNTNRKRNADGPADVAEAARVGMQDITERHNPNFRYVL